MLINDVKRADTLINSAQDGVCNSHPSILHSCIILTIWYVKWVSRSLRVKAGDTPSTSLTSLIDSHSGLVAPPNDLNCAGKLESGEKITTETWV